MSRNDEWMEDPNESAYRRRSRAVAVSRRGVLFRARRLVRFALAGAVIVAPLAYGGFRLAAFARSSPRFALDPETRLVLEGTSVVTRAEVVEAMGVTSGANLFGLSLDQERKQVEAIPWVRSAVLTRAYPRKLVVSVVERTPVAFVNVGGRIELIDADGVILEKPERGAFDFPVVDGLAADASPQERKPRMELYQQFMHDWAGEGPSSGWMLSEVDLADAGDLKTLLVQGQDTILVHFGRAKFAERFHTFLALLPEIRKTTPKIDSVDLRYPGQLVVNPQEPKATAAAGRVSEMRPQARARCLADWLATANRIRSERS